MAWFITALVVGMIPNQVLADELPKLPGGLNLQNILILFCLLLLMGAMGKPKATEPADMPKIPRNAKLYLLLSFLAIWYAPIFTPYADFPMSIDDHRVQEWRDEFTGILMFFVAARCFNTEAEMRRVLFVIVAASAYFVGYYLVRYYPEIDRISALPMPEWFTPEEWVEEQKWMIKKISGVFTQVGSNEMAGYYVYVAVFCMGLLWEYKKLFWRVIVPIEIAVLCMGIVYSASRGAMLATAGGFGYAFFRHRKWIVRSTILASALIPAFASDDSAAHRFELWKAAILMGIRWPLGIGYHVFAQKNQELNGEKLDTHNYFFRAFAELGPAGFFLVIGLFAFGARLGWKLFDTARTDFSRGVGRGTAMMWGALVVSNMFGDRISYANFGVVVWTITGFCYALILKEERERAAEAFPVVGPEPQLDFTQAPPRPSPPAYSR